MHAHFVSAFRNWIILAVSLTVLHSFAFTPDPDFLAVVDTAFQGRILKTSSDDLQLMEKKLEAIFYRDPDRNREAPFMGMFAAKLYLQNQNIQEAIWTLDRSGLYAEAEYLSQRLETFLKTEPIISITDIQINNAITSPKKATFSNGISAIVKPDDPGHKERSSVAEEWAYRFDRYVGANRIAMMVRRSFGDMTYSIGYFLENSQSTQVNMKLSYPVLYPDIYLIDFILKNPDRHADNSLYTHGKYMALIDHGRIGVSSEMNTEPFETFKPFMHPPDDILKNILSVDTSEFRNNFAHLFSPKFSFEYVADQIEKVQKHFSHRGYQETSRPFKNEERLNMVRIQNEVYSSDKTRIEQLFKEIRGRSTSVPLAANVTKTQPSIAARARLDIGMRGEMEKAISLGDVGRFRRLKSLAFRDPKSKSEFEKHILHLSKEELAKSPAMQQELIREFLESPNALEYLDFESTLIKRYLQKNVDAENLLLSQIENTLIRSVQIQKLTAYLTRVLPEMDAITDERLYSVLNRAAAISIQPIERAPIRFLLTSENRIRIMAQLALKNSSKDILEEVMVANFLLAPNVSKDLSDWLVQVLEEFDTKNKEGIYPATFRSLIEKTKSATLKSSLYRYLHKNFFVHGKIGYLSPLLSIFEDPNYSIEAAKTMVKAAFESKTNPKDRKQILSALITYILASNRLRLDDKTKLSVRLFDSADNVEKTYIRGFISDRQEKYKIDFLAAAGMESILNYNFKAQECIGMYK